MLKTLPNRKNSQVARGNFTIIASRYNARYVNNMIRAAKKTLQDAGISKQQLQIIRVPGAFEIPAVAAKLASQNNAETCRTLLCLGVILQGATSHAQHIGAAVAHALASIQIIYRVPVIHEVLTCATPAQACDRCLSEKHNRGAEAAATALQMAEVMRSLSKAKK